MTEWIKCSERLPAVGEIVHVFNGAYIQPFCIYEVSKRAETERFSKPRFKEIGGYVIREATHWMPIFVPDFDPPNAKSAKAVKF